MQKVHVLFEGYGFIEKISNEMRANCTSTLVQTASGINIIVDTMTAWDGEKMVHALKNLNLKPEDINIVVCTHGHIDHIGCNYLFLNAKYHIVGAHIAYHDLFLNQKGVFELDGPNVVLEKTPGHTLSCVSVIVRNTELGTIGICGDLFERKDDIFDSSIWMKTSSENIESQRVQRLRMAKMCDYIIPGHGKGFSVTEEIRETLEKDLALSKEAENSLRK